ncbi:MAG: hypothetical protein ACFE9R_20590, partial [Candidatus Hermodarchaeota archaeon]
EEFAECVCLDLYLEPHFQQYAGDGSTTPFIDILTESLTFDIDFKTWWKNYLQYKRTEVSKEFKIQTEASLSQIIEAFQAVYQSSKIKDLIHNYLNDPWVCAIQAMFKRKF